LKILETEINKEETTNSEISKQNSNLLKEIKILDEAYGVSKIKNTELSQQIELISQLNNFEREARSALGDL
jgi:hypothetical protein